MCNAERGVIVRDNSYNAFLIESYHIIDTLEIMDGVAFPSFGGHLMEIGRISISISKPDIFGSLVPMNFFLRKKLFQTVFQLTGLLHPKLTILSFEPFVEANFGVFNNLG